MIPKRRTHLRRSPEDQPSSSRSQQTIANQSLPAHRRRMQLAEAVAIRLAPARQVDADTNNKDEEQSQRPAGSIPSKTHGNQCYRDGHLRRCKQQAQNEGEPPRQSEVDEGFS